MTVSKATGGEFALFNPIELFGSGGTEGFTILKWDATAAEVQTGLESIYGAGNVQVTRGPGSTPPAPSEETWSYVVTFTGTRGDQPVESTELIAADGEVTSPPFNGSTNLEGVENSVNAEEITKGSPDGQLVVEAENVGDAEATGLVTVTDTLPEGLTAVSAEGAKASVSRGLHGPVTCTVQSSGRRVTCTYKSGVPAYEQLEILVSVRVEAGARTGELNSVSVSGGAAVGVRTATHTIEVQGTEAFGTQDYSLLSEDPGGSVDTQAGSHPFQLTSVVDPNAGYNYVEPSVGKVGEEHPSTVGLVKDDIAELPAGLVGNPTPFAQCTDAQFATVPVHGAETGVFNECPASAAVGVALIRFSNLGGGLGTTQDEAQAAPIFNMVPGPGEPARFAFKVAGLVPVYLNASVRTGADYGVTVSSHDVIQLTWLMSAKLTFWGVPGSPAHDHQRGWECLEARPGISCPTSSASEPPPFLIMPTSCNQPWVSTLNADSWGYEEHLGEVALPSKYEPGFKLDGCNHLPFSPSVSVTPDLPNASTSTGLTADVHVPQTAELNPEGLAESSVKDITVTLPEGVAVNPSGGDGLEACSEHLIGFEGEGESVTDAGVTNLLFKSALPGSFGSPESFEPGLNFCSNASKIGTADISTPLLPKGQDVKGSVYLATQNENPFGSLIAMYIVAEDPVSGTLVKLPGKVALNPSTGQLTTTFENSPELPFEDAKLSFFGGERAPLATPAHCGTYTTTASFVPWSAEPEDEAAVTTHTSATFNIEHGPNGGPCPGPVLPFSPSLTGGSTNINAGGFTPVTTTISREDGQQDMQSVVLHMPAGLEGLLSGVKLCPEAQANEGTCGPESLVGETIVSAGVGSDPVSVTGGRVYLTEKYAGAPFGLSIVNPVKAGPFDLEHDTANPANQPPCDCVVVRARIDVDPQTAELTITTDPSGPHAIPHMIDGVPVQIKKVNVLVSREHFTFNPTGCAPTSITGQIGSDEGLLSPVSVPFQATNCAVLKYTPSLGVSTVAHASRLNGASLTFKIAYPKNAMGSQSWFNYARFSIPKQLPARLGTIQQACLAATFEHNRGACPPASQIGHALVHTQVLPVPLEGPVYFVSYGGARFPDAVMVLHGYGITVELHGHTFIDSKTGVTSATFESLPDVPFESIAVTLPQGKYSEFGANLPHGSYDFCGQKLTMPIVFKASNGLEIHQNTSVAVTGCGKTLTRKQKLKAALTACHKRHGKGRASCERAARRAYGAKSSRTPKSKR